MASPVRTGVCSLQLMIDETSYTVKPRHRDGEVKVYLLTKQTPRERVRYVLIQQRDGSCSCTCPDAKFRKPEGGCKHVKALQALWLFD